MLPSYVLLRGTDMWLEIRLLFVQIETPDSDGTESLLVGLSGQIG